MPAIVTCPNCNVTLKPKTPLPAGTRIKCPKCQTAFVVPPDEQAAPAAPISAPAPAPKPAGPKSGVARPAAPKPAPPPEDVVDEAEAADDSPDDAVPAGAKAAGGGFKDKLKKVPMWGWIVGGVAVLFLMCGCCGGPAIYFGMGLMGSGNVSKANLEKIKKDMTEAQVKAILGEPSLTLPDTGGMKPETWKGSGDDFITIGFKNGKALSSVYQFTTGAAKESGAGPLP